MPPYIARITERYVLNPRYTLMLGLAEINIVKHLPQQLNTVRR